MKLVFNSDGTSYLTNRPKWVKMKVPQARHRLRKGGSISFRNQADWETFVDDFTHVALIDYSLKKGFLICKDDIMDRVERSPYMGDFIYTVCVKDLWLAGKLEEIPVEHK